LGDALMQAKANQSVLANPVAPVLQTGTPLSDAQLLVRHLREVLPLPLTLSEVEASTKVAKLLVAPGFIGSLQTLRQMEERLQKRFPSWQIALIPPMRPLPDVPFLGGKATMAEGGRQTLKTVLWALGRWQVMVVQVSGFAALGENGRKTEQLARQRADQVADLLRTAGLEVRTQVDYPGTGQKALEKEMGAAAWRLARIQPLFDAVAATENSNDSVSTQLNSITRRNPHNETQRP
jgi:hypothetical protein